MRITWRACENTGFWAQPKSSCFSPSGVRPKSLCFQKAPQVTVTLLVQDPRLQTTYLAYLANTAAEFSIFFLPSLVEKHHQTHKTSFGLLTLRLLSCLMVSKFTAASQLSSIVRNKKSVRGKRFGPELAPVACFKHLCTLIILP